MTNKQLVLKAGKAGNQKALAWIRKAGGVNAISEEMAARIVKICKLRGENHERT